MREQWILDSNDTEQLKEVTREYGKQRLADHLSLIHLSMKNGNSKFHAILAVVQQ